MNNALSDFKKDIFDFVIVFVQFLGGSNKNILCCVVFQRYVLTSNVDDYQLGVTR